jgi:hypothetical protein
MQTEFLAVSEVCLDLFAEVAGEQQNVVQTLFGKQPELVLKVGDARHSNHRLRDGFG